MSVALEAITRLAFGANYSGGQDDANIARAELEKLKAERDEAGAESKLIEEGHADDQRMIDRIADIIGLPQDQELHTFAFELWASEQKSEIARLKAALAEAREIISPFADAARSFTVSIAPDGIDDGLTVGARIAVMPEREAVLSTYHFSRASQYLKDRAIEGEVS